MNHDSLLRRLAALDPAPAGGHEFLPRSAWAQQLRAAIVAEPRGGAGQTPASPARRRPSRRAVGLLAAGALLAGGGSTLAAMALRDAPTEVVASIESLRLPAPDRAALAPVPGSLTPRLSVETAQGRWELYSVLTRGRGELVSLTGPGHLGMLGGCEELRPGGQLAVCGGGYDGAGGATFVGRVGARVHAVTAIYPGGRAVEGHVGAGYFLVTVADLVPNDAEASVRPERIVAHDIYGRTVAERDLSRPVGDSRAALNE